jgi:hypothetical protein
MLAALDKWELPLAWQHVRPYADRADFLDRAAEDVPHASRPPSTAEVAAQLAAGDLDPAQAPAALHKPTDASELDQLRSVYRVAAGQARTRALAQVQRYGDRIVSDVRAQAAAAIGKGDGAGWLAVAELLDRVRAAGLLPTKSGNGVEGLFDETEFRFGEPGALSPEQLALPPDELLRAAHAVGARPGVYDDQAVLLRHWTPRAAAAIG